MKFYKTEEGELVALKDLENAAELGYVELDKETYIKEFEAANKEEEVEVEVESEIPESLKEEVELLKKYGSVGKALVALDKKVKVLEGGEPAVIVSDNFQDGADKAPFNLQVRNTSGDAVAFKAVISDVPYSEIPTLVAGEYEYEVSKGADGYVHTFTGKLEGYASITITGGAPNPAGDGSGLTLSEG